MTALPRICVLLAPGINCDHETSYALSLAGAQTERVHINDLIIEKASLESFQGLVIPGGFSFGDDIASGKILGNKLKYLLEPMMESFIAAGKPIIGICNGFQVMVKMGLLPGFDRDYHSQQVTLSFNESNKFEDRWVYLRAEPESPCIFTRHIDKIIALPIRHGEGRLIVKDQAVLARLRKNSHISMRYVDESGAPGDYPVNPNGSIDDIAGICDESGLLFGLMPHPEAYIRNTQHPRWTSIKMDAEGDGLLIFKNMIRHIKDNLL